MRQRCRAGLALRGRDFIQCLKRASSGCAGVVAKTNVDNALAVESGVGRVRGIGGRVLSAGSHGESAAKQDEDGRGNT